MRKVHSLLKKAFEDFQRASLELERYYQSLEQRVKELKEELEKSRIEKEQMAQMFQDLMESLSNGVIVIEGGKITALNPPAQEILGLSREELLGQGMESLTLIEDAFSQKELTKSFGDKIVRVQLFPLRGKEGMVILLEDITELEKWRSQAVREERFNAVEEVVSHLVHQIRTPLSVVKLLCSLLEEDLRDDPRHELAQEILRGVEQVEGILSQVSLFIRPLNPAFKPLDLREPLWEVLDFVNRLLKENGIEFEKFIHEEPLVILGDGELLKHVFFNLIINAVEAMPQGGRLKVEAFPTSSKLKGELVQVVIEDTGIGIPKDKLREVFKPFFTTKPKGMGLGLVVVHKVMEAHKGLIELQSEEGRGTRFVLSFPQLKEGYHGGEGPCC
jgi:signal transduction histidine kinase